MARRCVPSRQVNPSIVALFSLLLSYLFAGSAGAGKDPGSDYIYFMSKREGYYGVSRSDLHRTEDLYTSRTVLEKFPGMARYQISYDVSPDGSTLAFSGLSERGRMDIFLLDLGTGVVKNLTADDNVDSRPQFSRDGRFIAFLSHEPGGRHYDNIVYMAKDGSGRKLITRDYLRILSFEFFPGDREILFVKYLPFHSAVAKVNLASRKVTDLTDFTAANRGASVSPDGSEIVYVSDRLGSFDIWIMKGNGSDKRVLYESPGNEYEPEFIASGKKVLFVSDFVVEKGHGKTGNSIYSIDTDGSHLKNLLPLHYVNENFFCFGLVPVGNGDKIYFEGKYPGGRNRTPSVYLLDVASDSVKQVIKDKNAITDLIVVPK